jgi:hypothetical protein
MVAIGAFVSWRSAPLNRAVTPSAPRIETPSRWSSIEVHDISFVAVSNHGYIRLSATHAIDELQNLMGCYARPSATLAHELLNPLNSTDEEPR